MRIYILFAQITFCILFGGLAFAQNISSNTNYLPKYDQIVLEKYQQIRTKRYLLDTLYISEQRLVSKSALGYFKLIQGSYFLFGKERKDDKAYAAYLEALSISEEIEDQNLENECLFKLIEYQHYTFNQVVDYDEILRRKEQLSKGLYQELEYDYLFLKSIYLSNFSNFENFKQDSIYWRNYKDDWITLIYSLGKENFNELKYRSEVQFAYIHEKANDFESAVPYYTSALNSARKASDEFFNLKYFTTVSNLLKLHIKIGDYNKAVYLFNSIPDTMISNQGSDDLAKVYGWVSDSYKKLNLLDSALYYQELRYQFDNETNAANEARKVAQIKSQYEKQEYESELLTWRKRLILAGSFIFLLAGATYGNHRFQSLKKKAVESELEKTKIQATLDVTKAKMQGEQEERKVIASVLHDQVASLLTAADMHLAAAKKTGDPSDSKSIEKADQIIKDVNEQVRNLSHQLVSPTLLKFGLVPAIDSLVDKMQNDKIKFLFQFDEGGERIESSKEIFLFRACSELMQNALKYSDRDAAVISLTQDSDSIKLEMYDNGGSKSADIDDEGLGLAHIKNNTEALLGQFAIDQQDGFKVSITLPVS